MLHIGKAGGGTIGQVFKLRNTSAAQSCHPDPCLERLRNAKRVFVALRDPVDRFVSAFNWRSLLLCKKHNETRSRSPVAPAHFPESRCHDLPVDDEERSVVHQKYGSNVNEFAVALCSNRSEAEEDLSKIRQARHSLSDWLSSSSLWYDPDAERSKLLPLVLEPGYNFTKMIGHQIVHAVTESFNPSTAIRQQIAYTENMRQKHPAGFQTNVATLHSSKRPRISWSADLTTFGKCCLSRYFRGDYEIIDRISETSCVADDNGECELATKSISERRYQYFKDLSANDFDFCSSMVVAESV